MRKLLIAVICLAGFPHLSQADTTSFELDAGVLQNAAGTALPDGTLLQLIASPSGVYTAPTATSFTGTGGDNTIISSFGMNGQTSTGFTGEFDGTITITLTTTVVAGRGV